MGTLDALRQNGSGISRGSLPVLCRPGPRGHKRRHSDRLIPPFLLIANAVGGASGTWAAGRGEALSRSSSASISAGKGGVWSLTIGDALAGGAPACFPPPYPILERISTKLPWRTAKYPPAHSPSREEQIVDLKNSDSPLAGFETNPLTKTLWGYKSACPARKRCVQHVLRGRDESVMVFWLKK